MLCVIVYLFFMNQCVVWMDWFIFFFVMQDVDLIISGWMVLWVNLRYILVLFVFIFKKFFVYICFELKNNWVFFLGLYGLCLYLKQFYVYSDDEE